MNESLKIFLNKKVDEFNQPFFIETDPISIPHSFSKKQDIEIAGFFAAIFSWGNRTTIINKSSALMELMDHAPHDFCVNHEEKDLKKLLTFKHRTFNASDLLYFIQFLQFHYKSHSSLETAFTKDINKYSDTVERGLINFYNYFFSFPDFPQRTKKHIASPQKKSSCKRLNMYLRWMVRKDNRGVDFGIWNNINMSQLVIPLDVHVARVAKRFNLISHNQSDWQTAITLTKTLKALDAKDPCKYDFALFGLGVLEKY